MVIIGRNEGARLIRCLESVRPACAQVVYVDSGSTDDSVAQALSRGAEVVALDMSQPFTAARARNTGFERLRLRFPQVQWVQFIDGDCELHPQWLARGLAFLRSQPQCAAVAGRRRERQPQASIYNQLCDVEWNTPVGLARAFGGDVLLRTAALVAVGGYRDDLIAGEEPELSVRLRAAGWQLWRLDADMTWHDAAISRLSQWWRRNQRSGHAFAEGALLHGAPPERHFVAETRRAVLWGAVLPAAALLVGGLLGWPAGVLLAAAYPGQVLRLGWRFQRQRQPVAWAQAFFLVLGRLPEAQGVLRCWRHHLLSQRSQLIEYK